MTGPQAPDGAGEQPQRPQADPWRGFRGVMAATLFLEAIVILLAIPVVGAVGGGLTPVSLSYLIGLAALFILLAGLQGRPWAIWMKRFVWRPIKLRSISPVRGHIRPTNSPMPRSPIWTSP